MVTFDKQDKFQNKSETQLTGRGGLVVDVSIKDLQSLQRPGTEVEHRLVGASVLPDVSIEDLAQSGTPSVSDWIKSIVPDYTHGTNDHCTVTRPDTTNDRCTVTMPDPTNDRCEVQPPGSAAAGTRGRVPPPQPTGGDLHRKP